MVLQGLSSPAVAAGLIKWDTKGFLNQAKKNMEMIKKSGAKMLYRLCYG